MAEVQHYSELSLDVPFAEFDFYDLYWLTFEKSTLGRMKNRLPLHGMEASFGLVSRNMKPKRGRRTLFITKGRWH